VVGKPFDITDYGVCYIEDMLVELPESTIVVTGTGSHMNLAIPRRGEGGKGGGGWEGERLTKRMVKYRVGGWRESKKRWAAAKAYTRCGDAESDGSKKGSRHR
jgi:hypothetical protein